MTFQRGTALEIARLAAHAVARGPRSSSAATIPASRRTPTRTARAIDFIVRGEGELTLRELLRALEAGATLSPIRGLSYRDADGFVRNPDRAVDAAGVDPRSTAQSRRARAGRLHAARTHRRRRRNVARLHLRLQLLLDHRDARPEFPPVSDRARARRHRRRAGARRPRDLPGRRQHHAQRRALRGAVPGDHRRGLQRHRLHRAGDDVADRPARRAPRAADEARRLPLRLPRHREHRSTAISSSCGRASKNAQREGGRTVGNASDRGDRASARATACTWSAA